MGCWFWKKGFLRFPIVNLIFENADAAELSLSVQMEPEQVALAPLTGTSLTVVVMLSVLLGTTM